MYIDLKELGEEQKELLKIHKLNINNWKIIYEDKYTLEVINRRGRRRVIVKKKQRGRKTKNNGLLRKV